jgi:hypothetical protein
MLGAGDETFAGRSSSRRVIGALSLGRSNAIPKSHGLGRGRAEGGRGFVTMDWTPVVASAAPSGGAGRAAEIYLRARVYLLPVIGERGLCVVFSIRARCVRCMSVENLLISIR